MALILGAGAALGVFFVVYAALAVLTAVVVRKGGTAAYDRATGPAFLVALAAGGYAFYAVALA